MATKIPLNIAGIDKTLENKYLRIYNAKKGTNYKSWKEIDRDELILSLMQEMAHNEIMKETLSLY